MIFTGLFGTRQNDYIRELMHMYNWRLPWTSYALEYNVYKKKKKKKKPIDK